MGKTERTGGVQAPASHPNPCGPMWGELEPWAAVSALTTLLLCALRCPQPPVLPKHQHPASSSQAPSLSPASLVQQENRGPLTHSLQITGPCEDQRPLPWTLGGAGDTDWKGGPSLRPRGLACLSPAWPVACLQSLLSVPCPDRSVPILGFPPWLLLPGSGVHPTTRWVPDPFGCIC